MKLIKPRIAPPVVLVLLCALSQHLHGGSFQPAPGEDRGAEEQPREEVAAEARDPGDAVDAIAGPVTRDRLKSQSFLSLDGVYSGPWSDAILQADPLAGATSQDDIAEIVNDRESVAEPFNEVQPLPDIKTELQLMMTKEDLEELKPPVEETATAADESDSIALSLEIPVSDPSGRSSVSGFDASAAPDQVDQVGGGSAGGIIFTIIFVIVLAAGFMVRMMAGSSF